MSGSSPRGSAAPSRASLIKDLKRRAQGSPFTVERAGDGAVVRLALSAGGWGGRLRDAGLPVAPEVTLDLDETGRTYVLRAAARELAWQDGANPDRPEPLIGGPALVPRVGRGGTAGLRREGVRWEAPAELARNPIGAIFAFVDDALADSGWTRRANTGLAEKKVLVGSIVAVVAFAVVGVITWLLLR
ncbi:hypothetical protein [Tersicoccus sp. Bi-70]|uniref:hypothetical protein n=1 Tax=Tersicoccus sp. Bi-70 TaxID=1897634 RepID=UPI000976EA2F|nr:hypothetical protein [Tersicoccus sp. Bi-70]OMH31258.1 hypothetical protein BGP79_09480 [Tersicoccus sp. Bi-70]